MKEIKGLDIGCLVTLWREEVLWQGKELWQSIIRIILIVHWALFCFITTIPFHRYIYCHCSLAWPDPLSTGAYRLEIISA